MKRVLIVAVALAALDIGPAAACGACVEDAVAATYDHAVIGAAMAKHQQVVFVVIDGPVRREKIVARVVAAASKVQGVQVRSVRASASPVAFSFALDRAHDAHVAVAEFRKGLGDSSARLSLIRIMRDGDLVTPN